MPRQELRPEPSGYKPSGRPFNELEQTPGHIGYSQPGTPQYRKFYNFAAKVFDAEAHHMVDLAYIDKMLYNAGFTSGANNTIDFGEARLRIIEALRSNGIDVGNVEGNISPLSQKKPKYGKTGLAHKLTHDAYKAIPEADDAFLRTLDEDQFTSYLVEKSRQRKDYVVQALENKYNALMTAHPELEGQSDTSIRKWIQNNQQEFGSLGDDTLEFTRRSPAPVPDQPRGRVSIDPKVNSLFRGTNKSYLGILPLLPLIYSSAAFSKSLAENKPLDAAGHAIAGAVGEVPVVGDALVDAAQGTPVADGTIQGAQQKAAEVNTQRQQKPTQYGYHGPDVPRPKPTYQKNRDRQQRLRNSKSNPNFGIPSI